MASIFSSEPKLKSEYQIAVDELHFLFKRKIITQDEFKNYSLQLIGVLPIKEMKEE